MKLFLTKTLLLISIYSHAQAPWRAKLFVHFLDSNNQIVTDTVWFGCDSLGAEGFQPGLDVIDTNLQWNKVYSADDLVKSQFNTDCANLKTNIIGFNKKESSFKFYAIGNPISISWDTLDFMYFDTTFRLSYTEISTVNGYINNIDQRYYNVTEDSYEIIGGQYVFREFWVNPIDSVKIIPESLHDGCDFSSYSFEFNINIILGPRFSIRLEELMQQEVLNLYPNPANDYLYVSLAKPASNIQINIFDLMGKLIVSKEIKENTQLIQMPLDMSDGSYIMQITTDNYTARKRFVVVK